MALTDATRAKLAAVSTATLTTVLLKRGLRNVFMQGPRRITEGGGQMVGEAYTLRYIPAREDLDKVSAFDNRAHPQRVAIENCPPGCVLVIDSRKDHGAASAGGILVSRLWQRGVAGVVTDGGFRDTPDIVKLDFPVYHVAPSAPTNLIRHHAVDIDLPIGCGDVAVYPRDVIVGDNEGVVVIPADWAEEVADEAFEQTVFEDFVQEKVFEGRSIFGIYPPDDAGKAEFALWRAEKKR